MKYTLFIITLFAMALISVQNSSGEMYSIRQKNSDKVTFCKALNASKGQIVCPDTRSSIVWKFQRNDVTIYYNDIQIFPYSWNGPQLKAAIDKKDCSAIIQNIYGAYYIDKLIRSYSIMGYLYENGICVQQNAEKALELYETSLKASPKSETLIKLTLKLKRSLSKSPVEIVTKDNMFYPCDSYTADMGNFQCSKKGEKGKSISKNRIRIVYYLDDQIYPYSPDWTQKIQEETLFEDCRKTRATITGPIFFENAPKANLVLAKMYEYGRCDLIIDRQKALKLYEEADKDNSLGLKEHIKELRNQVKKDILYQKKQQRLEAVAREERERQEEQMRLEKEKADRELVLNKLAIRDMCEADCAINKYQYNKSCFNACLRANDYFD